MPAVYRAAKSRSKGRESWAVIFRHPVRIDPNTGKPGRRVRRGLGTEDEAEADRLVAQLNQLLKDSEYWDPSAKATAENRFDALVVDIFFLGMEPSSVDFESIREEMLPLPGLDDDYRRVLLLGTTGAGKTTLVRQLLGTDPDTERFPSTSTAKTTIADAELILREGSFRAVVTFAGRDEVVDHLLECASEAGLAVFRGGGDDEVERRLLDHVSQRYRFSYILGRGLTSTGSLQDDDFDDADEEDAPLGFDVSDDFELSATAQIVRESVSVLRELVEKYGATVREELVVDETDERVVEEIVEETLDEELRADEEFHRITDSLMDEVERRFDLLNVGDLTRNRQGWPVSWSWETIERVDFLRTMMRFTSNYAPFFGRLLTPLVNGIRVVGPFQPNWSDEIPKLVLIDGEGLGHSPHSVASLSTNVSQRIEAVDAVVLVDNAAQPMQAAPVSAMKAVSTSGNAAKLIFCFTHFDVVKGDNLRGFSARQEHVLASAENVLKSIGAELGPFAERILRQRLERSRFFVGGIQDELNPTSGSGRRAIDQLTNLLEAIDRIVERPEGTVVRPIYDRANVVIAIAEAARNFHTLWRGVLGLENNPSVPKEHWTRVKALSRRLAEGWDDQYDSLRPVANLLEELRNQIYRTLQSPLRWEGETPTDDEQQQLIDEFSNAVTRLLLELASRRIREERWQAWQDAYAQRGTGSTFVRARIIAGDVYERSVPVPSVTPSPDQNSFLHEVTDVIGRVADEMGIGLR